jgi:hypothetical protein
MHPLLLVRFESVFCLWDKLGCNKISQLQIKGMVCPTQKAHAQWGKVKRAKILMPLSSSTIIERLVQEP